MELGDQPVGPVYQSRWVASLAPSAWLRDELFFTSFSLESVSPSSHEIRGEHDIHVLRTFAASKPLPLTHGARSILGKVIIPFWQPFRAVSWGARM